MLLLATCVGYLAYSQWQYGQLSAALEADIATLHRLRWERAPLRPPELDGNAAAAIYTALEGVERLPPDDRNGIAEQLYFGQPLKASQRGVVKSWEAVIDELRTATHNDWSATPMQIGLASRMPVPNYPLLFDGALMMLAQAAMTGGDGCLVRVADTIRLGQDLVTGAPMEASSVSMRITSVATRVAGYCTARTSPQGLRKASVEFHKLATESPASGSGIEVADLLAAMEVRSRATITSDHGFTVLLARLGKRPGLYDAWRFLSQPSRWREIAAEHYPGALNDWRSEHDWRARSNHPVVKDATVGVLDWIYDDMRGQALTRGLAIGTATLAERARRERMPREPLGLQDPALCDPYNGIELKFRLAQDGSELTLWSVGEDLRDDRGTDEWGEDVPLDVVVHLRLPGVKPKKPDKSTRKRSRRRDRKK